MVNLQITQYDTDNSLRIYRIPVRAFPDVTVYVHLILGLDEPVLVDCGSGYELSNSDLLYGLQLIHRDFFEPFAPCDIRTVYLTHGHSDHIGGMNFLRSLCGAHRVKIGIHPGESHLLGNHSEVVTTLKKNALHFFRSCGLPEEIIPPILQFFYSHGIGERSEDFYCDFNFLPGICPNGLEIFHVPGHSVGHSIIKAGNMIMTGDLILANTLTSVWPECLFPGTGLKRYYDSLQNLSSWNLDSCIALPGHEGPLFDLRRRCSQVISAHQRRITKIRRIWRMYPDIRSSHEIATIMYANRSAYLTMLALVDIAAKLEYMAFYEQQTPLIDLDNRISIHATTPLLNL